MLPQVHAKSCYLSTKSYDITSLQTINLKCSIIQNIMLCSPLKANQHMGGTCHVFDCFTLVSSLAYFSTLKMEATSSPKTSVDLHHQATECYIPLHNYHCENLKSGHKLNIHSPGNLKISYLHHFYRFNGHSSRHSGDGSEKIK
jgi:hypothetical protein